MLRTHLTTADNSRNLWFMAKGTKLGQRIKAFRLQRNWTQKQVAAFLGVSKPTVVRLELGIGNVMDLTRAKIERQLDTVEVSTAA